MSFEITGKLLEKFNTIQVSDRFKKREFVIESKESSNGMECHKWEKEGKVNYFTNLDAWRIEKVQGKNQPMIDDGIPAPSIEDLPMEEETDDLPF